MQERVKLFCGIEGGGTKTVVEIADEKGQLLAQVTGTGSNPWSLGSRELDGFTIAARVFHSLIKEALQKIELESNSTNFELVLVVICYSGGGHRIADEKLLNALTKEDGLDNVKFYLGNDCLAPVFTAFKNGGIVLISGTGSNCILVNPIEENNQISSLGQIKCHNAGGWGNNLGDEGSAYWIAQKAIKYLIDMNDNFLEKDNGMDELQKIIFEHFQVDSLSDLLPHFYSDFKKQFIASLTLKMSVAAERNTLFRSFFEEAGYQMARHIIAIQPKIDKSLFQCPEGLPVVCAGSVFKSWSLLKPGFIRCLKENITKCPDMNKINLVQIERHASIGAVCLAAKLYEHNSQVLKSVDNKQFISQLDTVYLDHTISLNNVNFHLKYITSYIKAILW